MRRFTLALTCIFSAMTLAVPAAHAGLVAAEQYAVIDAAQQQRDQVQGFLQRADVQAQLTALGVDPAEANARAARLSDAEAATLAARVQELPAGGDALGVILLLFVVLIITDILGFTDVFTFVRK
jgi:hypothetical protein